VDEGQWIGYWREKTGTGNGFGDLRKHYRSGGPKVTPTTGYTKNVSRVWYVRHVNVVDQNR
jgi:hypothetical protein